MRQPALQENESTSRMTHQQPTKALSMLIVSSRIWTLKRNPSKLDASSNDLQGRVKSLAIYHREKSFPSAQTAGGGGGLGSLQQRMEGASGNM